MLGLLCVWVVEWLVLNGNTLIIALLAPVLAENDERIANTVERVFHYEFQLGRVVLLILLLLVHEALESLSVRGL